MTPSLLPAPNGPATWSPGYLDVPPVIAVDCGPFDPGSLDVLAGRLGIETAADTQAPPLRLVLDDAIPREGYRLTIGQTDATIAAHDQAGVIAGLTTLSQLVRDGRVAHCRIEDAPRFEHRGFMLDCARHYFPVDTVKEVIEAMARVKLNVFHWHLTDDQGWRIESAVYPRLQQVGGPAYTQDEIRDVVTYAALRGIEVMPEIDLPGHVSALLAAYPELSCRGEAVPVRQTGGIFPITLCPGQEGVFKFLAPLLAEVAALFPSPRVHIGGDEAPKREWAACPRCQARLQSEGLASTTELQGYFTARVASILRGLGKRAVCWNDALAAQNLPDDLDTQYWVDMTPATTLAKCRRRSERVVNSDMFHYYFDYAPALTPLKKVYSGARNSGAVTGLESCLWTEHITTPDELRAAVFPRLYAMAEGAWSTSLDYAGFCARLTSLLGDGTLGPPGTQIGDATPSGRTRTDQRRAFWQSMMGSAETVTQGVFIPPPRFIVNMLGHFVRPRDLGILLRGLIDARRN